MIHKLKHNCTHRTTCISKAHLYELTVSITLVSKSTDILVPGLQNTLAHTKLWVTPRGCTINFSCRLFPFWRGLLPSPAPHKLARSSSEVSSREDATRRSSAALCARCFHTRNILRSRHSWYVYRQRNVFRPSLSLADLSNNRPD
jgi:hypothetical protein